MSLMSRCMSPSATQMALTQSSQRHTLSAFSAWRRRLPKAPYKEAILRRRSRLLSDRPCTVKHAVISA
jgi:hypothetical protein